jgi:sulfhydrogenase subunit beta (sulfur reductase)
MGAKKRPKYLLHASDLSTLFLFFDKKGYHQIGPVLRDGALMLEELKEFSEIATNIGEEISKAHYRIKKLENGSFFQNTLGPQSFKRFLYPPKRQLWSATKGEGSFKISPHKQPPPKMVFWGIRSCDLHAIHILDRIFLRDNYTNDWYRQARENLITVAINCTHPNSTCFCTSSGTGPSPEEGFDYLLTEVFENDQHYFVTQTGNQDAENVLGGLGLPHAKKPSLELADALIDQAKKSMSIRFDPAETAKAIRENPEHRHWEEVAKKCMSCANCTLVCPTCFCSTTEDITDLTGNHTERWLRWDSCFAGDYSYIHGGNTRPSIKSRYRQWMSHKLSNWYEQFGSSGCVGCGRCIAWCPVGIDLIEEAQQLSNSKRK